jgi:hypothetical protein
MALSRTFLPESAWPPDVQAMSDGDNIVRFLKAEPDASGSSYTLADNQESANGFSFPSDTPTILWPSTGYSDAYLERASYNGNESLIVSPFSSNGPRQTLDFRLGSGFATATHLGIFEPSSLADTPKLLWSAPFNQSLPGPAFSAIRMALEANLHNPSTSPDGPVFTTTALSSVLGCLANTPASSRFSGNLHLALLYSRPTAAGSFAEVDGDNYARVSLTSSNWDIRDRYIEYRNSIQFVVPTTTWGTPTYWSIMSSSIVGHPGIYVAGPIASPREITSTNRARFGRREIAFGIGPSDD